MLPSKLLWILNTCDQIEYNVKKITFRRNSLDLSFNQHIVHARRRFE